MGNLMSNDNDNSKKLIVTPSPNDNLVSNQDQQTNSLVIPADLSKQHTNGIDSDNNQNTFKNNQVDFKVNSELLEGKENLD